jgi:hypothetical protein
VPRVSERDPDEPGRSHPGPRGAQPEPAEGASDPAVGEDEERASTPFDHPFFLPALLIAFTLWFGYDGWLNADFDPQWIGFNRWGFFILLPLAAYYTIQAVRETRRGR